MISERTEAALSRPAVSCIGSSALFRWGEYDDSDLFVLARRQLGSRRHAPVAALPWRPKGGYPVRDLACATIYRRMFAAIDETLLARHDWQRRGRFGSDVEAAVMLYKAGLIAESLMWIIQCANAAGAGLSEGVLATLHSMALAGIFDTCPYLDDTPESMIATMWATQPPETWGLPPSRDDSVQTQWLRLPDALDHSALRDAAHRSLRQLATGSVETDTDIEQLPSSFVLTGRFHTAVARLRVSPSTGGDNSSPTFGRRRWIPVPTPASNSAVSRFNVHYLRSPAPSLLSARSTIKTVGD